MNNVVTTLAPSFLIESSSFLQATRKLIDLELAIDPPPPPGGILYAMIF